MERFKMRVVSLLLAAFTGIAAVGCSSDEFFGFEEANDNKGIFEMANTTEYKQYLEANFKYNREALDTTNREIYGYIDNLPVYSRPLGYSYQKVVDAFEFFKSKYPDYSLFSEQEKQEMYYYAIISDAYLRDLSGIKRKNIRKRTKSDNGEESNAFLALMNNHSNDYIGYGEFAFSSSYLVKSTTEDAAKYFARQQTVSSGKECGGMAWSDGSGCVFYDYEATTNTMRIWFFDWGPYIPSYTFHIHPSGVIDHLDDKDSHTLQTSFSLGVNGLLLISAKDGSSQMYTYGNE